MRIDRYILKELAIPLLAATLLTALLFSLNELIYALREFNLSVVPILSVLQMILLRLPSWLVYTLPIGVAIASSLAIGRMSRESEITAMRAAGIPIRRILLPVVLAGAACGYLNFQVINELAPRALKESRKLQAELLPLVYQPSFKAGETLKLGRYRVWLGSLLRQEDGSLALNDILLLESISGSETMIWRAKSGSYRLGIWEFPQATLRHMKGNTLFNFESRDLKILEPIRVSELYAQPAPQDQTVGDLRESIRLSRLQGIPTARIEIELVNRFSSPASCMVFALISALASLRFSRSGAYVGLLNSLLILGLYFNVHIIFVEVIGKNGWLPPIAAAWSPNAIFLLIGCCLMWRIE